MFKLVGRAVAQGGVETVEVEVGIEVVGDFQEGFFLVRKGPAVGQQFGFEGAPAGLGVVVGFVRPAETGQGSGLVDASTACLAGVLAAAVGMIIRHGAGWLSVRAYSSAWSTSSVDIRTVKCQPITRREQASRQLAR